MLEELEIPDKELKDKLNNLINIIKSYNKALVAFSGGVDSTLLAYICKKILGENALAVTVNSPFFAGCELLEVKTLAGNLGLNHLVINANVLDDKQITSNDHLRCKYCKEKIVKLLSEVATQKGHSFILDGSNIDDNSDYRPGMEAAKKLGVKSPLLEAGFTKSDIKNLAEILNIPNWNKPAAACLASRIPYGTKITEETLKMIENAEAFIKELGYSGFRVRHHDQIARIELNPDDIERFIQNHRDTVRDKLLKLGYKHICLDLSGYKSGSMNNILGLR